jgi:hypothetical protein
MNRATAAAIAVAAVLGITGGTWLGATVGTGDTGTRDPGTASGPSDSKTPPSRTPTQSPTFSSPAQLLYMDAGRINDGYTHLEVEGFVLSTIDNLVRIRGGWLVIQRDEASDPSFHASKVAVTGEVTDLGDFIGAWDISLDGDLFTALRGNSYTVIDLAETKALDLEVEPPKGTEPTAVVSFAGQTILTGWIAEDGTRRTLRTQIASGRSQPLETGTLTGWVASPGGLLIAGQVSNGAISCLRGGGLTNIGDWWTNCQWTLDEDRPKYSANGEQLLVVPLDPDGASPETYGVLRSGSGDLIATIDAPRHAIDAEWGDNNEIFVLARKSARNPAGVLWRCQVGGDCTLERPPNGAVVLGAGV